MAKNIRHRDVRSPSQHPRFSLSQYSRFPMMPVPLHSESKGPIRNALGIMAGVLSFVATVLSLKEMAGRDNHVQQFFDWLSGWWTSAPSIGAAAVSWIGFSRGFSENTPSAWYSWLLVGLLVVGVLLLILLAWSIILDGIDGDNFLGSAIAAFGVIVAMAAAKGAWVLLFKGTLLTMLGGVGLAIFTLVVLFGALGAMAEVAL